MQHVRGFNAIMGTPIDYICCEIKSRKMWCVYRTMEFSRRLNININNISHYNILITSSIYEKTCYAKYIYPNESLIYIMHTS